MFPPKTKTKNSNSEVMDVLISSIVGIISYTYIMIYKYISNILQLYFKYITILFFTIIHQ